MARNAVTPSAVRSGARVREDDEGTGGDTVKGEDCTNQTADLAGRQESCHVPFFVVSPYTQPGSDTTFFDHYSAGDQGLVYHEWKNASCDRGGNHGDIADAIVGLPSPPTPCVE